MKLKRFLTAVCVGFLSACASVSAAEAQPNIVIIVADDMGWADIGYHNPEIISPNLDRLAETGVVLETHYVQPQCTPTRVALMTGRYPSRFGLHCTQASNEQAYPVGTLTLASMLKTAGYATAITGKWHMGSKPQWGPNNYGFDYSYGSLAGAIGMYDHRYRLNSPDVTTWHRNHQFIEEVGHVTDLVAEDAVQWIQKEHDKPFFLYVPFHAVHTPLVESHRLVAKYDAIANPDRRLFAAAVTHLDEAIGRIVEALDQTGRRDNTLIIFFSDNGGIHTGYRGGNYPPPDPKLSAGFSSNAPLRSGKTHVYEGGMRVPALVNWKNHVKPAKIEVPMHAVDWMPTLAHLVNFKPPEESKWDGQDIWPQLTGAKAQSDRQLYWVWGNNRQALRAGDWKILRDDADGEWELYHLSADPTETNDLAEKQPDKLAELMELYKQEKMKDADQ